jgi:WD40 repeat protein
MLPTSKNIFKAIDKIKNDVPSNSFFIVFLAGHGIMIDGKSYYCPIETDPISKESLLESTVPIEKIYDAINGSDLAAKYKLMFVDACRNDPQKSVTGRNIGGNARSIARGIKVESTSIRKNCILFQSCNEGEHSFEPNPAGLTAEERKTANGYFTAAILDCFRTRDEVSLFGLSEHITKLTEVKSNNKQHPQILFPQSHGRVVLWKGKTTPPVPINTISVPAHVNNQHGTATPVQLPAHHSVTTDNIAGQVLKTFGNPDYSVGSITFSQDGSLIASGGNDNAAKIWNVATGEQISSVGHSKAVSCVRFSPSGKFLLSTALDGSVKYSKIEDGETIKNFNLSNNARVYSAAFAPNEKEVIVGTSYSRSLPANVVIIDIEKEVIGTYAGHKGTIYSVAFSRDGQKFLTGSENTTAILWDTKTKTPIRTLQGHAGSITHVEFSSNEKWILTSSGYNNDQTARLWNVQTGVEIRSFGIRRANSSIIIHGASLSPDGRFIATITLTAVGSRDNYSIKIWDTQNGKEKASFPPVTSAILDILFSPDGKSILMALAPGRNNTANLQLLSSGLE